MHWKDLFYFDELVERLQEIDRQLDEIAEAANEVDPDAYGLIDAMESLIGEGFLQCQLYLIERKGEHRPGNPYACGPRHKGQYLAQLINAAGNYRKHRAEWPRDPTKWGGQQNKIAAQFRDAGVQEPEQWLSNLLLQIADPDPPRFAHLVPLIVEWREAFDMLPS